MAVFWLELCCSSALPNARPEEWKLQGSFFIPLGLICSFKLSLSIERGKWQNQEVMQEEY